MLIDEVVSGDGTIVSMQLLRASHGLSLVRGDDVLGCFPDEVVLRVVLRYGRPLAVPTPEHLSTLTLEGGGRLRSFPYRAPVDLEAKLYLLLDVGDETLAVLGRQVAAALQFLADCSEQGEA